MDECGSSHDARETCTKPPLIERNWPLCCSVRCTSHFTYPFRCHVAPNRTSISTLPCLKNKYERTAASNGRDGRPRAPGVQTEINGRDLKSGIVDAARAPGRGERRPASTNRRPARANRDEVGRAAAEHRPILSFLKERYFLSFLLPRPFNRQRKWNKRARKLQPWWLYHLP